FFSLAVGVSCMVTHSLYLEKDINLTSSASAVVSVNIFFSLLSSVALFYVVFAFVLESSEGPPLLFMVLPEAFAQIPLCGLFLSLFLLLFLFAIFTSAFSLYEIIVVAFTASGRYSRGAVSVVLGIVLFIVA